MAYKKIKDVINEAIQYLKTTAENAHEKLSGLKTEQFTQDGNIPNEKTIFMVSEKGNPGNDNGIKLLYIFNEATEQCFIKKYYEIPDDKEHSCQICPQIITSCDDIKQIKREFDNYLKTL